MIKYLKARDEDHVKKRADEEIGTMRKGIRTAVNIFLAAAPFTAWFVMMGGAAGVLSSRGLESLKYFTILSNLLEGIASLVWLLCTVLRRQKHKAEVFKYIACLSVFLTFITVMIFLGPLFGYKAMFAGPNLWLHLIVPLVSVFETALFAREDISGREAACSVIPVFVYGSIYLGNVIMNGRGNAQTGWNDFYGFATWGIPVGILIFAGICLVVFGAGLILRRIMRT